MSQFFLFVLLGLGPGALIAGLALSVVVAYRGSNVVNLATGAIAMLGAYVFYGLRTGGYLFLPPVPFAGHRIALGGAWSIVPAVAVALIVCGLTGSLFDVIVLRRLRNSPPLAKLLASLGLLIVIQAIAVLRFGTSGQLAPSALPASTSNPVRLFGVGVPLSTFVLAGIVVLAAAVLAVAYRFTRFGVATRAAAENETKAAMAGLSPNTLSLANTVLASVLAGALGVLAAPQAQLDPITIPLAVVPALGAALLARFTSFAIAAAAGLGMGIIQSLVTYASSRPWFPTSAGVPIPGVAQLIYFLIIVAATYWRGGRIPQRGVLIERRLPAAPTVDRILRPAAISFAVCVVAFLVLPYDFRQALTNSLIAMVLCLSLVVVIGFAGQVSLAQVALAGISAFVVSKLSIHLGIGFPLGPAIGACAATLLGVATGASALRARGIDLAIVTLAAAVAVEDFLFDNPTIGGGASGSPVNSPHLFSLNLGPSANFPVNGAQFPSPVYGLVCAVAVVGIGMLVAALRRSDLGQRMLAVRSNERAAAAAGIDVRRVKLIAFAISSFIAGIAGALYAYDFGSVTSGQFGIIAALAIVAFAYVGGITTVSGAAIGGLLVTDGLVTHAINKWFGVPVEYQLLVGGLALIATIIGNPAGIAGALRPGPRKLAESVRISRGEKPARKRAALIESPHASLVEVAEDAHEGRPVS
jgi:branched-chain amino acid transport system permease protein